MFRSFTLGNEADEYELYRILNSSQYVLHSVDPYISESGMSGVLLKYAKSFNTYTRQDRPFRREIKKFFIGEGGRNEVLDDLLNNPDVREIKFLSKFTEDGPIAVLDYEVKLRKTRR